MIHTVYHDFAHVHVSSRRSRALPSCRARCTAYLRIWHQENYETIQAARLPSELDDPA